MMATGLPLEGGWPSTQGEVRSFCAGAAPQPKQPFATIRVASHLWGVPGHGWEVRKSLIYCRQNAWQCEDRLQETLGK